MASGWILLATEAYECGFCVARRKSLKKNNGCMQLIPGTQDKHLLKPSQMKKMDLEKYVLDLAIDPKNIDESKAIDVELNPGDISIHNPL